MNYRNEVNCISLCKYCRWIGHKSKTMGICPSCGRDNFEIKIIGIKPNFLKKQIDELWSIYREMPLNPETEELETEFLGFEKGARLDEIWVHILKRLKLGTCRKLNVYKSGAELYKKLFGES